MTNYMIQLFLLSALALAYAQSAQDDWCYSTERVENGKISCTGTARNGMMESKTLCTFICNEKYRRNGPEKIWCFAAEWLNHDTLVQSNYRVKQVHEETLCEVDPDAEFEDEIRWRGYDNLASQRPAERPERCAKQLCHLSFNGQTKIGCLAQNCCWNENTNKCHAKICTGQGRQQRGISKRKCLNDRGQGDPVCKYNAETAECYTAGKIITTVNEITMPSATHTWSANLLSGKATFDTKYDISQRMALARKLPKTNIVSVDDKLTKPKRTPWGRVGSCTFGGQAVVGTEGKEVVTITLEYNDWDLSHTFALANTETQDRKQMLATMFTDFRSIQMKFPRANQQRTARKPHPFISGIKTIKFTLTRATSTLDYTMELRNSKMSGSIVIPNLFNSEEKFRIFMNQGIKWSRGFGLCSVNVNAS